MTTTTTTIDHQAGHDVRVAASKERVASGGSGAGPNAADVADLIAREARNLAASIENAVRNRKLHPSYGYHKAGIVATVNKLEGVLYAWWTVNTGECSAAMFLQASRAAEALGLDLPAISTRAHSA